MEALFFNILLLLQLGAFDEPYLFEFNQRQVHVVFNAQIEDAMQARHFFSDGLHRCTIHINHRHGDIIDNEPHLASFTHEERVSFLLLHEMHHCMDWKVRNYAGMEEEDRLEMEIEADLHAMAYMRAYLGVPPCKFASLIELRAGQQYRWGEALAMSSRGFSWQPLSKGWPLTLSGF